MKKLTQKHWIGIAISIVLLISNLIFFFGQKIFWFFLGIAFFVGAVPFITSMITETGREKEKEDMFLEFARNLVESVKVGTPISRSIIQMRNKNFGTLTPHIQKLANQIAIGIPVSIAFETFASDINNRVISRSISLITEAEKSGGQISMILESTAKSVSEIEDIKKERKASTYNLVVQGYIIFLIFLVIMIVVQMKFIPLMLKTISDAGVGMGEVGFGLGTSSSQMSTDLLGNLFLILILVQGLFCGLVVGKLSEGTVKSGIKHSAILVATSYLITTGVRAFMM